MSEEDEATLEPLEPFDPFEVIKLVERESRAESRTSVSRSIACSCCSCCSFGSDWRNWCGCGCGKCISTEVASASSSSSLASVRVGIDTRGDVRGECVGVERLGGNGTVKVGPGLTVLAPFKLAKGCDGSNGSDDSEDMADSDESGSGGNGGNEGNGSGGGGVDSEYDGSGASVCLRTPLTRAVVGLRHPSATLALTAELAFTVPSVLRVLKVADEVPFAVTLPPLEVELEFELELEEGVSPKTRSSRAHSLAANEHEDDPDSCEQCEPDSVEEWPCPQCPRGANNALAALGGKTDNFALR